MAESKKEKKSNNSLFIIVAIAVAFIVIVFLANKRTPIDWITNYEEAVKIAKESNKPLLVAFYTEPRNEMTGHNFRRTYNNPKVKEYIETQFVPVLINAKEHPDIARKFNVGYFPSHFVKHPDIEKIFGPRQGHDPAGLFIKEIQILLDKLNEFIK